MKIIVTGSLGNISKHLTEELVNEGHSVVVICSSPERKKQIENLGVKAAIGKLEDEAFVVDTFKGADAVYGMVPPSYDKPDMISTYRTIASNYAKAITKNKVKRMVALSSFGAHLSEGTGNILGAHHFEEILRGITNVKLTIMRPTYFYYNFLNYLDRIKASKAIYVNYGGDNRKIPLVSPKDIASAIAEELQKPEAITPIQYVVSEELTTSEITDILGKAIDKNIKWHLISDKEMKKELKQNGMPEKLAASITEMFSAMHQGKLAAHYIENKPSVFGKVKLKEFAREDFVTAYHKA